MKKSIYVSLSAILLAGIFSNGLGQNVNCDEFKNKIGSHDLTWNRHGDDLCFGSTKIRSVQSPCLGIVQYYKIGDSGDEDGYKIGVNPVGYYFENVKTWDEVLTKINKPGKFQDAFNKCLKEHEPH